MTERDAEMAHRDTYTLRVRCRNCGREWDEKLPKGSTWQDAQNMHDVKELQVLAGFGTYCERFHTPLGDENSSGVFCHDCQFTDVSCTNCGSFNVEKTLPRLARVATKREWEVLDVHINQLKLAKSLEHLSITGWTVLSVIKINLIDPSSDDDQGLFIIAYKDVMTVPASEVELGPFKMKDGDGAYIGASVIINDNGVVELTRETNRDKCKTLSGGVITRRLNDGMVMVR